MLRFIDNREFFKRFEVWQQYRIKENVAGVEPVVIMAS